MFLCSRVSGRIGFNGFLLTQDDAPGTRNDKPLAPHDVLLRRAGAPAELTVEKYSADEKLEPEQKLPDTDLLKAIHAYVSDFYRASTHDKGHCDFRSMNETALLAMGILLEEAAAEVLGEAGDMALVEAEGLEMSVPETRATQYQVKGRVKPFTIPPYENEEDSDERSPDQRQKKRHKSEKAARG